MINYKKLTEDIVKETIKDTHFNNNSEFLVFFNRKWNEFFYNEMNEIIRKNKKSIQKGRRNI